MKNILWFREVSKDDIALVGGKGANLGELTIAGLPVPPGFIVTAEAYFDFLNKTGLKAKIKNLLRGLDVNNSKKLNERAARIQKEILAKPLPSELIKEIIAGYQKLYTSFPAAIFVAVRSSATAEDLPTASFAGQQATFLNVSGSEELVQAVSKCWASLFEPRAIYYREVHHFDHMKVGIAVPIQKMIQAEKSGIMFTVDPVTSAQDKIVIEAGWGLGEAIVSGSVTPDRYVVQKAGFKILSKSIEPQSWKIVKVGKVNKHLTCSKDEQKAQKLTDEEIKKLAELGTKIEAHYKFPQDIEWAIEGNKIYFVQSRPVTTLTANRPPQEGNINIPNSGKRIADSGNALPEVLLKGIAASLGLASGSVKIIHSPNEIYKVLAGDVLTTEKTSPDFVPAMKKAVAIITETGGQTSHAAIVSRELGIPCVVGTGTATHVLKTGQIVSVDGAKGLVYKGKISRAEAPPGKTDDGGFYAGRQETPVTATKVYVNLGEPSVAEKVAQLPSDGVGLLRAEFMIAEIGEHPRALVKAGKSEVYLNKLVDGLKTTCRAFAPRPVVYRTTDFKTNEYRRLKGGQDFEPEEENPMLGFRGALRYIKEPDLFKIELEAIKKVRGMFENLWLMIPFVRTIEEFRAVEALIQANGLERSSDFKLWMMVEVPSNVILMNRFCQEEIDGFSIGSNDLTQLILGIDRDNENLAEEFDERDEAVKIAIAHIIRTCRRYHKSVSICGQAATVYPEIAELMVQEGATSVSVSPDAVIATRRLIASVEKKIMLNRVIENS